MSSRSFERAESAVDSAFVIGGQPARRLVCTAPDRASSRTQAFLQCMALTPTAGLAGGCRIFGIILIEGLGVFMAQAATQSASAAPTREDFAKLIDESFGDGHIQEGAVVKGTVVAIERDLAVIDVGLKTEGRVALREFAGPGRSSEIKIGDTVEVYLERIENALGEAVLSRDKARREESWGKLEKAF